MLHDEHEALDPLGDAEEGVVKNRAKVGSARPSSLLYTYGPGAIMDLPELLDHARRASMTGRPIWKRRDHVPSILEPRLLNVVRLHLGPQVDALRPFPWQPKRMGMSSEGSDLGIPSRVFPQWFRCTGCDYLGPLPRFNYTNTHPFRPDLAQFTHKNCPGRGGNSNKKSGSPAVPAQHLLTCTNGHLDEFPYSLWVHRGSKCAKAELPDLKMRDANVGKSVGSTIICGSCGATRGMAEAQGAVGREKLPQKCRGRHPHLNAFDARLRRPTGADHDGCLEPVVRLHPVDHRHAAHRCRGEGSPRRPAARRTRCRTGQEVRRRPSSHCATSRRPRWTSTRGGLTTMTGPRGSSRRRARARRTRRKSARKSSQRGTRSTCSCLSGATSRSRHCSRSSRTPAASWSPKCSAALNCTSGSAESSRSTR